MLEQIIIVVCSNVVVATLAAITAHRITKCNVLREWVHKAQTSDKDTSSSYPSQLSEHYGIYIVKRTDKSIQPYEYSEYICIAKDSMDAFRMGPYGDYDLNKGTWPINYVGDVKVEWIGYAQPGIDKSEVIGRTIVER